MEAKSNHKISFLIKTTLIITSIIWLSSCSNVYISWKRQLQKMPSHGATKQDISFLLGKTPDKCEIVSNIGPIIGINILLHRIKSVIPNSPADTVGIKPGMFIKTIDGQKYQSDNEGLLLLRRKAKDGKSLRIETTDGNFYPIAQTPKRVDQCYWHIGDGVVASSKSSASVNQYGGYAYEKGKAYNRFFNATCRFYDGYLARCSTNWQY